MDRLKQILKKLVLSVQVLLGAAGLLGMLYHIIVAFHDVPLSEAAKKCFESNVRKEAITSIREINGSKAWDKVAETIIELEISFDQKNGNSPTGKKLQASCKDYLEVKYYTSSALILLNTWYERNPVTWRDKIKMILLWLIIPAVLIGVLQGLSIWARWLLK